MPVRPRWPGGRSAAARIRTYGQVAKALRGLRFADEAGELPQHGDKLFFGDKEIGYVSSALRSPALSANIGLGYVRRAHNEIGTELKARTTGGELSATIVALPFVK